MFWYCFFLNLIAIPPAKIRKIATFRKKNLEHVFVQIKEKHKTRSVPVRIVNTSAFFLVSIFLAFLFR